MRARCWVVVPVWELGQFALFRLLLAHPVGIPEEGLESCTGPPVVTGVLCFGLAVLGVFGGNPGHPFRAGMCPRKLLRRSLHLICPNERQIPGVATSAAQYARLFVVVPTLFRQQC